MPEGSQMSKTEFICLYKSVYLVANETTCFHSRQSANKAQPLNINYTEHILYNRSSIFGCVEYLIPFTSVKLNIVCF